MTVICDICQACHDPRCPMGMFHEPDRCGLRLWVEWQGQVLCPECTRMLDAMEEDANGTRLL